MSGYLIALLNIFLMRLSQFVIVPFFFIHLSGNTETGIYWAGILFGALSLSASMFSPLGGFIADRVGYRACVSISLITTTLSFMLIGRSTSVIVFAFLCVLLGLSRALFEPASQALLVQQAPDHIKNLSFSHRYIAINAGAAIGPIIGVMISKSGLISVFDAGAILFTVPAVTTLIIMSPARRLKKDKKKFRIAAILQTLTIHQNIAILLMASILSHVFFSQLFSTIAIVLTHEPKGDVLYGHLLTANAVLVIIFQIMIGNAASGQGDRRALFFGTTLFALSCAWPLLFSGVPSYILFILCFSIGEMFIFPTVSVVFSKMATENNHATLMGIVSFSSLGAAIGPFLGSVVLNLFGTDALYYCMAVTAGVSGVLFAIGAERQTLRRNHL